MKDINILEMPKDLNAILYIGDKYLYLCNNWIYDTESINLDGRVADIIHKKNIYHIPYGHHLSVDVYANGIISIFSGDEHIGHSLGEVSLGDITCMEEILDGLNFVINSSRYNEECFKMYKIHAHETESGMEVVVKESSTLTIANGKESLIFYLDGNEITYKQASTFFKETYYNSRAIREAFKRITFNQHSNHVGMKNIYIDLLNNVPICKNTDTASDALQICFHCSTEPFFLLAEAYIKESLETDGIYRMNPFFTGKAFPNPKNRLKISKRSKEYILNMGYRSRMDAAIEAVSKLEANPRISPAGMNMFFDFMENCRKITEKDKSYWNSVFNNGWIDFSVLDEIFNTFDITMKTFIDRLIRGIFQNNISPNAYIDVIYNYIRMCKIIGIETEKKLPKNVISLHDIMVLQIEDIQDKKIKELFVSQIKKNKELLTSLPDDTQYVIISPEETSDLIMEGKQMNHCVGSYIDRVAEGLSKIFFLRKKAEIEKAYVTIELDRNNGLVQAKASCNTSPSKEDMEFIYSWVNKLGGCHE